jgi:hypothetical protein
VPSGANNIMYYLRKEVSMNYIKSLAVIILITLFLFSSLTAGVYIQGEDTHKMHQEKNTTKIFVDKNRLRVETGENDNDMVIIFREDKNLFWMVDMKKKEYREMTKDDVKKMKAKIDEGMKQIEEQMKNLPPEQRKMMEQMMPAQMNIKKIERPVYTKAGKNIKVKKWNCTHYIGEVNGKKKQEVWTIGWDELGIDADEMKVFRDMGQFFSSLAPDMTDVFKIGDKEWEKNGGFAGMPVKSINFEEGKVSSEFEINEISKKDFSAAIFEVPAGFEKVANEWE